MEQLKIFENAEFGQIRTVVIKEQPMFCLVDLCGVLDIKNSRDCKSRLREDGVVSTDVTDALGRPQATTFISESNLYKVIFQSRKESAERFTDWVTSEVLPSIRKTGAYQKPLSEKEMLRIQLGMIDDVEQRVDKLENTMVIDYGQQRVLENLVKATVMTILGGKGSPAYKEVAKKVFSECNRDIKDRFLVNSRSNVARLRFEEACKYITNWRPCINTIMMIEDCNAQEVFA